MKINKISSNIVFLFTILAWRNTGLLEEMATLYTLKQKEVFLLNMNDEEYYEYKTLNRDEFLKYFPLNYLFLKKDSGTNP